MTSLLISDARLQTFRGFAKDEDRALELHNLTLQVGSSLMAVIALIELALRNLTDSRVAADFEEAEWMLKPPRGLILQDQELRSIATAKQHAQKATYAKLSHASKKALDNSIYPHGVPSNIRHETLSRKRWETFQVTQGQLIAQTTIFLWKRLFSAEYEKTLWERSLRKLFPQKSIDRSDVSIHLEMLYVARNRVAHHEPIYGERLDRSFEAVRYLRENLMREKGSPSSAFMEFTNIQFLRLYIDYTTFRRSWALLVE